LVPEVTEEDWERRKKVGWSELRIGGKARKRQHLIGGEERDRETI